MHTKNRTVLGSKIEPEQLHNSNTQECSVEFVN